MQNDVPENEESYRKLLNTPYQLIAIMAIVVTLITGLSIVGLYNIGIQQQQKRLIEIVHSRAAMIGVIAARTDDAEAAVLEKIKQAHETFRGFGDTGEFTLARLRDGHIEFLLRHRHSNVDSMEPVAMTSRLAEPMRRALKGLSGTLIGPDYRGEEVLAAHIPVGHFGWGIVAKIDLSEIRRPYLKAAFFGILGATILISIGGFFFMQITRPLADALENGRRYNRMLFNESPIGLALCDLDGTLIDINPAYAAIIGRNVDETLGLSYWEITPASYASREIEQFDILLKNGRYGPYEKEYLHKNGHSVQVRLSGRILERDGTRYIWSSVEDISEAKYNEKILREAALVFEHTHEGIMITDRNVCIVRINGRFEEITGYGFDEVAGQNPRILRSGKHDEAFYRKMWQSIQSEGTWYGELWNRRKDGETFPTLQSITAVRNASGQITGYVSVFSDISVQKANEAKLAHLASHDPLTALPNRMHFNNNLEQAIHRAKRHSGRLAVLFLDLNRFKEVNDTLGHDLGDRLLQAVAERLLDSVREEDTVARFGGDEFAVVLAEIRNGDDAVAIAQKILDTVTRPLTLDATTLNPSTSIGISLYPEHGDDGTALVKAADQAMYTAKEHGDTHYALYGLTP